MSILMVCKFSGEKPDVDDLICMNPNGTVSKLMDNSMPIIGFREVSNGLIQDDEILVVVSNIIQGE